MRRADFERLVADALASIPRRFRVGVALEQRRRDEVDALIGRLRGKNRRNEELEGVGVVQLGISVWVLRFELVEDVPRFGSGFHMRAGLKSCATAHRRSAGL